MTQKNRKSVSELHAKWMANPGYRKAYDGLAQEFEIAEAVIRARMAGTERQDMSEMVERVAKAMQRGLAINKSDDPDAGWAVQISEDCRQSFRRMARTAIAAMREPSPEMQVKWRGEEHTGFQPSCHMCGGHIEGWRIMIDAALADDAQPKDPP